MKISFLFPIILSTATLFGQRINDDLKEMELKGQVKSIVETHYVVRSSDEKAGEPLMNLQIDYSFNTHGYLKQETYFNVEDGSIGSIAMDFIYDFDSTGHPTGIRRYRQDQELYGTNYFAFNDKWQKIKDSFVHVQADEKAYDSRETYKYDASGNCIETLLLNSNGSFVKRNTFLYDDLGRKLAWTDLDEQGDTLYSTRLNYISKGEIIEYAKGANLIDDIESTITFKFDPHGHLIEETHRFGEGKGFVMHISYTLDSYGNWIKKVETGYDQSESITERKITYYQK